MPGVYDEMSERSYPDYTGGTAEQRAHRDLLRRAMEKQGFTVFDSEWWHFDYRDWPHYAIGNTRFEEIQYRVGPVQAGRPVPPARSYTLRHEPAIFPWLDGSGGNATNARLRQSERHGARGLCRRARPRP